MRKYAILKNPFPINNSESAKRVMLYMNSDEDVYVFFSNAFEDLVGIGYDEWYQDLELAESRCREMGIKDEDWIYISDPLIDCQHDLIAPIRIKGRNAGNPRFGEFEFFDGLDWLDIKPGEKKPLRKVVDVQVMFDSNVRKTPPSGFTYRPHFVVDGAADYLGIQFVDLPEAPLGCKIHVRAQLIYDKVNYELLRKGAIFSIKEGGGTVGRGTVLEEAVYV